MGHGCCYYDIIRFKTAVIDGVNQHEGIPREAINAVHIRNRTKLCTVGFLSKAIVVTENMNERVVCHFAQVIELYDLSAYKTMAVKSKRNMGIESFRLLDDIQDQDS